ncbi:MAG: AAA family ATPase, partial [Oscillospiraceae bacterium]|nr:AAA family ATPase [Oscillospiraceae bacterium]
GKTMLAKATACEAGVTILTAQGNQFLKSHVGEGPESVRDMFRKARKYAPSILFVDEIDAIAKQRTGSEQNGSNEEILTAFLAEMDGFQTDSAKPVFVLAATNFDVEPGQKTSLDSALMRRFDRRIYVGLPNKEERIRYLKKQYGKKPIFSVSETMTENIAVRSTGMSLASLASVIELSLRMAIRDGSLKVTDQVFEEAFETFNSGEVKKWDPSELERTARHEAGHAFLSWESGKTPAYLTVVARGNHGGYMQHADNENKGTYTKEELLARIRTALGGRAAEIVYYGETGGLSTGASGDLAHATSIAKRILCAYGMDEDFGLAVVGPEHADTPEIRAAVNRILKGEMARAVKLITENRDKMDALVSTLINANRMTGEEIEAILSKTAAAV